MHRVSRSLQQSRPRFCWPLAHGALCSPTTACPSPRPWAGAGIYTPARAYNDRYSSPFRSKQRKKKKVDRTFTQLRRMWFYPVRGYCTYIHPGPVYKPLSRATLLTTAPSLHGPPAALWWACLEGLSPHGRFGTTASPLPLQLTRGRNSPSTSAPQPGNTMRTEHIACHQGVRDELCQTSHPPRRDDVGSDMRRIYFANQSLFYRHGSHRRLDRLHDH